MKTNSTSKVIFIIPGYRQLPTSNAYKQLSKVLKAEGYSPFVVKIPWKNSTISQNTEYFLKRYEKTKAHKRYILGFSYGAMIAFIAATKVKTSGVILCSLSPYFKEDSFRFKNPTTQLMSERYIDFSSLHSKKLAKQLKTKTVLMLYGAEEARVLIQRVTETFEEISTVQKSIIKIKKTDHNIGNKNYLAQIHKAAHILL